MRTFAISSRTFEIHGDSKDDYYTVYGCTMKEVQEHRAKLGSYVLSKLPGGRFKKLSDCKKFIKIVVGEI